MRRSTARQPTLIVNDVKSGAGASGAVALWLGPGTVAHFRNLRVTASPASTPCSHSGCRSIIWISAEGPATGGRLIGPIVEIDVLMLTVVTSVVIIRLRVIIRTGRILVLGGIVTNSAVPTGSVVPSGLSSQPGVGCVFIVGRTAILRHGICFFVLDRVGGG